jgi:hypothetical protein
VVGQRAYAVRAGGHALGGRHELVLGWSMLRGGLFVPALADEVDVDARWRLRAGRGAVPLGRRLRLAYQLQHATTAFGDARAGDLAPDGAPGAPAHPARTRRTPAHPASPTGGGGWRGAWRSPAGRGASG